MKVLIVGAGGQGGPCASILAREKSVEKIILGDIKEEIPKKVKDKIAHEIGEDKIEAIKLDASRVKDIIPYAKQVDVVIDLVVPAFSGNVMKAALKGKAHYVNTAFNNATCDAFEDDEPIPYDEEFNEAGLTALLGCGAQPGRINLLAKRYVDKFDKVESVLFKVAYPRDEKEAIFCDWDPGWSPRQALIDYSSDTVVFRDGEFHEAKPFSDLEKCYFGDVIGKRWISQHDHEEVYSFPRTIRDKGIKRCEFKYEVDEKIGAFVKMGFVPGNQIDINGTKISPFEMLMKMVHQPGDYYLEETREDAKNCSVWCMDRIEIKGEMDGKDREITLLAPSFVAIDAEGTYDACGTVMIDVAMPAVIGAFMCVEGAKKGAIVSEELDVDRFFELLQQRVKFEWEEIEGIEVTA